MGATEHFTFNMMGALAEQLDAALPYLTPDPLDLAHLEAVKQEPGVYQLRLGGELVYIGKADRDLRSRLGDHRRKISGRLNIALSDMTFTGLYLDGTWIPVGPEEMLIKLHQGRGLLPWNNNGFGNNDPGRERDTSRVGPEHFDSLYPADLQFPLPVSRGTYELPEFLLLVKRLLPYVFRFENQWARHPDYAGRVIDLDGHGFISAEVAFSAISRALPPGWQLTALPGYAILYKESRNYPSAREVWTSA